jgi:adenosylcobinamide-GDP ribazoletransferase
MWRFPLAISFLTIFPARIKHELQAGDLGRSAAWFPMVGLLIGAVLVGLQWILQKIFPPLVAAPLLVSAWAIITGGLHLDGVADCGDGLFHASTPERRLEIMKDPRLGSFGAISLMIFLLLKVFSIVSLQPFLDWRTFLPLFVAPVTGRWLLLLAANQPHARPGGMGADFKAGFRSWMYLAAAVILILLIVIGGWKAAVAVVLAHIVGSLIIFISRRRLGGITGDVYGLLVEIGELVVLLSYSLRIWSQ